VSTNPNPSRRPRSTGSASRPAAPGRDPVEAAAIGQDQLLCTPVEAAEKLRVRGSWLRSWAAARQVPCTFLGKHLRFSAADLAAIVAQNSQALTGRRPRRRPASTVRYRDLPAPPRRSVDPPDRHDHNRDQGSIPWHG
jgi:hypothetical protein